MGALVIDKLRKTYGAAEILKGIDISIEAGEFLILVGPSGCGKSTLLSMIAGLDTPTAGYISIAGRDITHLASKDRDIAMVFQSYALYPNMTVAKNIEFALEMRKVPREERRRTIEKVAKTLQIDHLLDRKPGQLSGGQRQRVAMGRALARDPKLFLFDEPLSNLDAKLRVEMRAEIKLLHQRTRTTTVYVTHDQVEAMTLGDRIAVMKDGVVQQFGTPDDIYSRPATRFVAEFIGSPAMNLLQGQLAGGSLTTGNVQLALTDDIAQWMEGSGSSRESNSGQFLYGLRPEHISFTSPEDARLQGRLLMVEPTGPETYATVETNVGRLTARVPGRLPYRPGDNVNLGWLASDAHLFESASEKRVGP